MGLFCCVCIGMTIGKTGLGFTEPSESWMCTNTLAYIDTPEAHDVLHQLWVSSLGRVMWKAIPKISPYNAEQVNGKV